ncbi:hypothetical protein CTAYLR_005759 [Chrysophaeum taylorii]|uniref:Uncharacterized protein n=1 Tax=Chrysophaeum taylorii TaxID=2483200 RepID=A0AAD7UJJ3_9STRA|nr:hypothetical protein CTAYLR_005759 [Chrysophaeum taylorii]
MAAFDPDNAEACFAELKRRLDVEEEARESVPVDELLDEAFDLCFYMHPSSLSPEARTAFFDALDRKRNGRVSFVKWRAFRQQWRESGKSMSDHVVSLRASRALTADNLASTIVADVRGPPRSDRDEGGQEFRESEVLTVEANAPALRIGASGASLLDGFRFELKLALPIEFCLRILKNLIVRYGGGSETRDAIIETLKEDATKVIESLDVLRTADLNTAFFMLKSLLVNYRDSALSISSEDELKKNDYVIFLRDEAAKVRDFAISAFYKVSTTEQKILAIKIAMSATVVMGGLGVNAKYVGNNLKLLVEELLRDERVKRAVDAQRAGGVSLWNRADDREKLLCDMLVLVLREHTFAVSHGFRNPATEEPLLDSKLLFEFLLDRNGYLGTLDDTKSLFADEIPTLGRKFSFLRLQQCFESSRVEDAARKAEIAVGIREDAELNLTYDNIDAEGAAAVSAALKTNMTLRKLLLGSFGEIKIGDEGATAISSTLETNTTLRELYLASSNIGNAGALAISKMLETNNALRELCLFRNSIECEDAAALSAALKAIKAPPPPLEVLYLGENNVGEDGAKAVSEMLLNSSTTLNKLDLSSNEIGDEGAVALLDSLKTNKALKVLYLSRNKISDNGAADMMRLLEENDDVLEELDLRGNKITHEAETSVRAAAPQTLKLRL